MRISVFRAMNISGNVIKSVTSAAWRVSPRRTCGKKYGIWMDEEDLSDRRKRETRSHVDVNRVTTAGGLRDMFVERDQNN